jgi:primosomal protein N'
MYILSISPLVKSSRNDTFSYFSKEKALSGTIVNIPLRNKIVKGLVIDCQDFKENKLEIRQSEFALKKIKNVTNDFIFTPEFLDACKKTAQFFATSTGSVLETIISKNILENNQKIIQKKSKISNEIKTSKKISPQTDFNTTNNTDKNFSGTVLSEKKDEKQEDKQATKDTQENILIKKVTEIDFRELKKETGKFIMQSPDQERFQDYKSIIRSRFAKKGSVFFCVPTNEDLEIAREKLTKGIEDSTICLSNRLPSKEIIQNWNKIIKSEKPVLIIATGFFLSIPRKDIRTIIIERENSQAYRTIGRPYLDIRKFSEFLAKEIGAEIIFGDLMIRSETLKRFEENELFEFNPIKFRFVTTANQKLIDMRFEKKSNNQEEFNILSEFIEDLLLKSQKENKRTFLLTSRKGLAPMIICRDCGQIVICDHCQSPMVLYGKNAREKENFLKCRKCGLVKSAGIKCKKCDSWRLNSIGIGIENVLQEIQKKIPDREILILDKDHAKTPKQIKKIINQFYEEPASILIGTEMALLYLSEQIDNTVIISIDAMFSLPDFRVRERILNILIKSKDLTRENFIIQTRHPEDLIFRHAMDGNLAEFYRFELADRKKYDFPPFSLIIKISSSRSTEQALQNDFKILEETFKDYDFNYYPAFIEKIKNKYIMNGIIRVEKNKWPDFILQKILINLGPQYNIIVDAESIL